MVGKPGVMCDSGMQVSCRLCRSPVALGEGDASTPFYGNPHVKVKPIC